MNPGAISLFAMHMDSKLTSHQRFISKFERDLKAYYDAGDDQRFMQTFSKYTELTEPSETIEALLYETLLRTNRHGELIDYSLEQMNNGDGDYETHMVYMLKGLLEMGNYEEVLEFTEHLLEESIPQSFRIDILTIRQYAANKIRGLIADQETVISPEDFEAFNLFEKLEFVERITETSDIAYSELIKNAFDKTERNELQTAMLLYLRSVRYNGTLTIEKCDVKMDVIPSELTVLEAYFIVKDILPKVLSEVEQFNPSFTEAATELLMGHAIYMYPVKPDFNIADIADAYVARIQTMLGMDNVQNADAEILNWLDKIERDIARHSL